MLPFLLGLAALVIALYALQSFARANPAIMARRVQRGLGAACLALSLVLVTRGSLTYAFPAALLGLWLILGPGTLPWPNLPGGMGRSGARLSKVTTDHLEMELDLDTGEMSGRVLKGFFAGRKIEGLRPVELAHLWQDCRFVDPQSAQLVEAYLDRVHPTWRDDLARAEAAAPKGPDGKMSREEAFDILGLPHTATEEAIRQAHRALMLKLHPDRGGSTYLAAKINEAKDVALGGR